MKVYFISGLGADERVFQYLDLPNIECVYIKWERPLNKESLSAYARRLIPQIVTENPVLVGMSFGGMVAQEIAKIIPCSKVILVASVKSHKEYDWKLRWVSYTKIYKTIPAGLLKWSNRFTADYYFSTKTKESSQLLHQIIKDTDPWFLTWAIDKIMTWRHEDTHLTVVHIHGVEDRIFPAYKIREARLVSGTGHFMIVDKHEEVSRHILEELTKSYSSIN